MTTKEIMQDGDISKEYSGDLIFNPYNPNNKEISENEVCDILKKYGVPDKVHNINLYKRAFIHRSYCKRPKLENDANGTLIIRKIHKISKNRIIVSVLKLSLTKD